MDLMGLKKRAVALFKERLKEQLRLAEANHTEAQAAIPINDDLARKRDKGDVIQERAWLRKAHRSRVEEIKAQIIALDRIKFQPSPKAAPGSLVLAELELGDELEERLFFIHSGLGGEKVEVEGRLVLAVSPQAPLGRALLGREEGDDMTIAIKGKKVLGSLAEVY